ncbi:serine/threonine protein kinase [Thermosporothrix hazakensis]|jgi:serine/threonine protein kinase|uniref:Serine/threonine protein kinase n=2 Tax=Thermosporothrix TaxID=768650 RepID=A0A326TXA5_THEHA|nr:serine/threonine-protein kinase [Thermosporothrix hazakensis]PZW21074.1 serine/threonine protein kinase [Thermosporothrix hazakensis]BBH88206.1 hypothetical protein KTC_29570 [Thermosporothrix sp. COM3]GCE46394.1 hypothetical protein KTH_12630 [Thermosporothrix hazakensis]
MAERAGQQLGHYTILRLLGEGGFAQVYLGEHMYLKSQAAIKVLQTRLSSPDDMQNFLKEAQTIARLTHPNIIRVLDFGVEDETPYLVMEYAANGTLRQRHPRGERVPLQSVVSYVKQVADALQFAHDERLIHRDVKPENMLVGRRDEILLSDFGIAMIAQNSHSQKTQDVIGTVAYMSPEQIQGHPRPASDQYSLAIVAYEWLTGDRPFNGSFTELCTQHMFARPPLLRDKLTQISPLVENVIMKALEKDPKQRFEHIRDFANALEAASQGRSPYETRLVSPNATQQGNITMLAPEGNAQQTSAPSAPFPAAQTAMQPEQQNPSGRAMPTFHAASTVAQTHQPLIQQPGQPQTPSSPQFGQTPQQQTPSSPQFGQTPQQQARGFNVGQYPGAQPHFTQTQQAQPGYQTPYQQPFGAPQQGAQQQFGTPQQPFGVQHQSGMQQPGMHQQFGAQPFGTPHQQPFQAQQPELQQRPSAPDHQGYRQPSSPQHQAEEPKESLDEWLGPLAKAKWRVLGAVVGLILLCLAHRFQITIYGYTFPVAAAIPLFFGAAFGPGAGIFVGIVGAFLSPLFGGGMGALQAVMVNYGSVVSTNWWVPLLYYGLAGAAGDLSVLLKPRRYPSLGSSFRACLLAIILFAVSLGVTLYQAQEIMIFPQIGLILLENVGFAFIALAIYSIAARLIDPS